MEILDSKIINFHRSLQKEIKEGNPFLDKKCLDKFRNYYRGIFLRKQKRLKYTEILYLNRIKPVLRLIRNGLMSLDCGCNNGTESILMGMFGASVTGIDIQKLPIEIAKRRIPYYEKIYNKKLNLEFVNQDVFSYLKKTDKEFDLVYMQETISHIYSLKNFLKIMNTKLCKGGTIVISDTNKFNPYTAYKAFKSRLKFKETIHIDPKTKRKVIVNEENLFTPIIVERLLKPFGLMVQTINYYGFTPPFFIKFISNQSVWNIDNLLSRLPFIKNFGAIFTLVAKKL